MALFRIHFSRTAALKIVFALAATPLALQVYGQGAGSAEAQARMYLALTGATNNVVDQLLGLDPVSHLRLRNYQNPMPDVRTYLLFDPRMNSDMTMAATFKIPMDALYWEIYDHPRSRPHGGGPHFPLATPPTTPAVAPPATGIASLTLAGVIGTVSSIAGISPALFAQTTAQTGVAGPTDADAFIATQLVTRFASQTKLATVVPVNVYAPSIFPLLTTAHANLSSISNNLTGPRYTPDNTDPVTEFTMLQADVNYLLKKEQGEILDKYTTFSKATAPIAGLATAAPPNVASAYTTLVADLKAAIAWLPPIATGTAGSAPPTGVGSPTTALPYASIQADIQLLEATLVEYKGLNDAQLYKSLKTATDILAGALPQKPAEDISIGQPNALDSTIQLAEAMTTIGATLATSVAPYGTVSSASPGASTPTTIANIITRGWQTAVLLNTDSCKVLRVHLEVSQGTDKTTSYAVKWFKDSSAMAMLSFMVLDKPTDSDFATIGASSVPEHTDNIKLASWSMAYYPFQNADDALDIDRLQIMWPDRFNPSITVKGHKQRH